MAIVKCDSLITLKHEVDNLRSVLTLPETEESWDTIAKAIIRLTDLCNNGACDFPAELTASLRTLSRPLNSVMCSERSRLSGAAIDLLHALAAGLGSGLEPLLPLFFPTLLVLCTRTNKVFITRARACILAFIENTQLPIILTYLSDASRDKSVSLRLTAVDSVLTCLNCFNPPDLEKDSRAKLVEDVIKATARDASADVRKVSRKVFDAYTVLLPNRVDKFVAPLTPVMKKYLDIKSKVPSDGKSIPTSHPRSRTISHSGSIKSQLSLSTSALQHTEIVAMSKSSSGKPKSHGSSSSLSIPLSAVQLLESSVNSNKNQSGGANDMPPPDYIPTRRGPPGRPQVTASRSASSLEDRKRTTSAVSTLSGGSGPSRPPSAPALASSQSSEKASHPLASSARRIGRPAPNSQSATATMGGASRVNRLINDPKAGDGPIRPSNPTNPTEAGGKARVVGGARRVPLPPPATKEDDSTKESLRDCHSTSESVTKVKVGQTTSHGVIGSRPVPSKSNPTKADVKPKPKPVPKPTAKAPSVAQGTAKLPAPKPPRSDTEEAKKLVSKAGGATQPTFAQLARAKAAVAEQKSKNAKPVWGGGRSAPSKPAAQVSTTKGLSIQDKAQGTRPASRTKVASKVVPEAIPLPPSPGCGTTPASVQLPLSPCSTVSIDEKADSAVTPEDEEEPLATVDAAESIPSQHPHDAAETNATSPLDSAQFTIPDILQETTEVTPTPAQISLAPFPNTPISNLLTSIQQGFLFTPCSPLSPPQSYIHKVKVIDDGAGNTPTPLPLSCEVQDQNEGHVAHDHLVHNGVRDGVIGQKIPELTSVLEMSTKMPSVMDETERQVLVDVEVNC